MAKPDTSPGILPYAIHSEGVKNQASSEVGKPRSIRTLFDQAAAYVPVVTVLFVAARASVLMADRRGPQLTKSLQSRAQSRRLITQIDRERRDAELAEELRKKEERSKPTPLTPQVIERERAIRRATILAARRRQAEQIAQIRRGRREEILKEQRDGEQKTQQAKKDADSGTQRTASRTSQQPRTQEQARGSALAKQPAGTEKGPNTAPPTTSGRPEAKMPRGRSQRGREPRAESGRTTGREETKNAPGGRRPPSGPTINR